MSQIVLQSLPEHLKARRTAQRGERTIQVVALLAAVGAIVAAAQLISPIKRIRQERQLVIDPASIKGLPPDIALLGKLGTFRALAIDWAAIRAERLKEQGKVYEAKQLHDTVCALAPRFPDVWIYAAWNMAYNISVMQYTPEARWKWVRNGIEILRDQGIPYNPRAVTLYKELAWIYWHKIGDFLDDEHLNYKRALAVEMESVLGPPPVALSTEEYFDWFQKIAEAPPRVASLINGDSEVAQLARELASMNLTTDHTLLEFVARNIRPEIRAEQLREDSAAQDSLTSRRLALLQDPKNGPALDRLLSAVRSEVLREEYKIDPVFLLKLMEEEYGPLDLRNVFTHALYWSSRGDVAGEGRAATTRNEAMTNARYILFSISNLVTRGRITLYPDFDDPFSSYIDFTPDLRFIPYAYDTYLRLGKKHFGDHPDFMDETPGPNYLTGFVTNMHNWITLLYIEGGSANLVQAENLYAWLRQYNPHPDGSTQEQYLVTLEQFVMGGLKAQMDTYRAANAIIGGFIRNALQHFALGQASSGTSSLAMALTCYEYWMRDTSIDINDRRKLQTPMLQLRDQIEQFMKTAEVDPLVKVRLWHGLPAEQRQMVYDTVRPTFERICEFRQPPWVLARAFPEPIGMDEFRQRDVEFRGLRREDVEQGTRYKP